MAKKAKKVSNGSSWRTRLRKAKVAESRGMPRQAAALREEAAILRRSKRAMKAAAKGSLTSGVSAQRVELGRSEAWQETIQAMGRENPGHGEIVGGADAQLAEKLVALARKKGGKDAVQNEIMALRQISHYEGRVASDKAATARMVELQQGFADRVVCGFLAEVDEHMRNGLEPASTFTLNSFTVVKIVDALNKAGYRATGKT